MRAARSVKVHFLAGNKLMELIAFVLCFFSMCQLHLLETVKCTTIIDSPSRQIFTSRKN